jgi:hypothetical protein
VSLTAIEELEKEITGQGFRVYVPGFGLKQLTQLRKRACELALRAFKGPKADPYLRLTRRNREDPSHPVVSMGRAGDPKSRQIHRPRRETCHLNLCIWLFSVISLVTWRVDVTAKWLKEHLWLGVRRIPRAFKEFEQQGYIKVEKKKGLAPGAPVVYRITVLMSLWEAFCLDRRATKTRDRILGKERSDELKTKAKEYRSQQAEKQRERKEHQKEERAEAAWLEPFLHDCAKSHGPLPRRFVEEIKRFAATGMSGPPLIWNKLLDFYRPEPPPIPP